MRLDESLTNNRVFEKARLGNATVAELDAVFVSPKVASIRPRLGAKGICMDGLIALMLDGARIQSLMLL